MSAEISKDDPRPESEQAADILRQEILRGDIKPGGKLGSIRDLTTRFKISGMTVQRALAILREDGLIMTTARGSYVRDAASGEQAPRESAQPLTDLQAEVARLSAELADVVERIKQLEAAVGPTKGKPGA